ncbi:MAG: tRNA (N(6)-L-threonylcarbamoyladenosine(37)-C(2))-methylthiotransferase MtaB [Candidatus Omnitrophota bacterium]|nr:tRNA (N(6)-L-threonylcarbamoyladenosine(37)-C(2))-methylthiotransferase MtaB [Candidatus Omnitrophota bacterium]
MNTVAFFTLGCKVNQYDTQNIRENFLRAGFKAIDNGSRADIYVINTCTVTASADRKSRRFIHYARRYNPRARIIVTGCYTELDSEVIAKIPGVTHIVKNQDKGKILDYLNGHNGQNKHNGLNGLSEHNGLNELNKHNATGISSFFGHTRAFLKIQDGCNNFCSYCKVPKVRGASRSRPLNELIQEAKKLVRNSFKEIVLCGICLGSYGKDLQAHTNLVDVIEALENIEGLLRIRLSSIEAGDVSDRLIQKMAQSKKLCRHLHIPIQSGDDEILERMNRNYCRNDYLNLIKRIKSIVPEIAITTDVLVGFPGEKEDNFQNTVDLIREIMPLRVHIFPYSKRLGTRASNFEDRTNPLIIKERISKVTSTSKTCALDYKKQFLNKDRDALIEGRSKENKKYWEGYTDNYIKVWVKSDKDLKNKLIQVRLKKINKDFLLAGFC